MRGLGEEEVGMEFSRRFAPVVTGASSLASVMRAATKPHAGHDGLGGSRSHRVADVPSRMPRTHASVSVNAARPLAPEYVMVRRSGDGFVEAYTRPFAGFIRPGRHRINAIITERQWPVNAYARTPTTRAPDQLSDQGGTARLQLLLCQRRHDSDADASSAGVPIVPYRARQAVLHKPAH